MSRISFENYGLKAKYYKNETKVAGRFKIQEKAEKNILIDVINKMSINSDDNLLDIGCGSGNLLIPLSFICRKVTGIDHVECVNRINARLNETNNIETIPGNFLDVSLNLKFDKILCYSVLQYLSNEKKVIQFILKALKMLKPGGTALFGDIPNTSLKNRFIMSSKGKIYIEEWNNLLKKEINEKNENKMEEDIKLVQFDDKLIFKILEIIREKGFNSFIIAQHPDLPFGYTREDILIKYPN